MFDPKALETAVNTIWDRKYEFVGVFFVVVLLSYAVLYIIDFIPEPIETETAAETVEPVAATRSEEPEAIEAIGEPVLPATVKTASVVSAAAALPISISFDSLNDKELTVLNPQSNDIAELDAALLEGVVRHPDSADFANPGNIFILGHSSYLPNVLNKNFQAFNGIQDLTWGDTIRVRSAEAEYVYRVDRVYEAKATEVVVPNDGDEARLTLATCDSFGTLDDRFIVEAVLVKTVAL